VCLATCLLQRALVRPAWSVVGPLVGSSRGGVELDEHTRFTANGKTSKVLKSKGRGTVQQKSTHQLRKLQAQLAKGSVNFHMHPAYVPSMLTASPADRASDDLQHTFAVSLGLQSSLL